MAARDHILGSLAAPHSVWADRQRIYLATQSILPEGFPGGLYVLARDRHRNFPVLDVIPAIPNAFLGFSPVAVTGDEHFLYSAWQDGVLRVYVKGRKLRLSRTVPLPPGVGEPTEIAIQGSRLYVGSGSMAASHKLLVMGALNPTEVVVEFSLKSWAVTRTFQARDPSKPNTYLVLDRRTGRRVGEIGFLRNILGAPSTGTIWADDDLIAITAGSGCCSAGYQVFDAATLAPDPFVNEYWTNAVVHLGNDIVAGTEAGTVALHNRGRTAPLSTVDLRALTGHAGSEDIEIRSLWADHVDNLVFAGSSWGNPQSRNPRLPAFFVLERRR